MTAQITITALADTLEELIEAASMPTTREEWLASAADRLRPAFLSCNGVIPVKVRYSCGWPAGRRGSNSHKAIGQCWYPEASADGHVEIFVSPAIDDPVEVLGILVHELVHACLDVKAGHGPRFRKLAVALGLEGKMTATVPGPALRDTLSKLASVIGPYPHAELRRGEAADKPKKQSTRMIKVECPDCGYLVRTTRQWLSQGTPTCVCGARMRAETLEDDPEEGEGE